jgi:hypothetical protein
MDEFWIEPIRLEGSRATVRASFNEFSIVIVVERKDGQPIETFEAEDAYAAVAARIPSPDRRR